jgi:mannose-6-phosphate isomerase-like protein (cupin superfamily)
MSFVVPRYPPDRYTRDEPEVSATLRRADTPADYESFGVAYHYLANQQKTDDDYGLYRVDIGPVGGGPGPHFHRAMSEAFFVLSGTLTLYDGRDWIDGTPGDFLYVPPGGVHGFRNEAGEPASALMLFAPGAPREAYFEGFAHLADMTDEERREWFIKNDNYFLEP